MNGNDLQYMQIKNRELESQDKNTEILQNRYGLAWRCTVNREYEEVRNVVHDRIVEQLDYTRDIPDEEVLEMIDAAIVRAAAERGLMVAEMKSMRQDIFHSIRRLDVLQDLVDDTTVTEIMVNGPEHIFIERDGRVEELEEQFTSMERYQDVIQKIVAGCNRVVNESSPIVDARLPGGERVNVVLAPVALNGPILTIRRFPDDPITMERLIRFGSIPEYLAEYLKVLVRARYNIFISGGTGSGKTTFLNALSYYIPDDERVITIEDNAELQIRQVRNLVTLEARNANVEGCVPITIRDLIRSSLRMRPDRIIVGEVRGEEAIDMLQAMNTGHDGSMSTGHANGTMDMIRRLETMIVLGSADIPMPAVRGQIASGIDILVHLGRLRDRSRKMLEISEVCGLGENGEVRLQTLFRFKERGEENGRIVGSWQEENTLRDTGKLAAAGLALPAGAG